MMYHVHIRRHVLCPSNTEGNQQRYAEAYPLSI